MDVYDQSYQMCVVWISHFLYENGFGCGTNPLFDFSSFIDMKTLLGLNGVMPL
jgi:hypothetical protein